MLNHSKLFFVIALLLLPWLGYSQQASKEQDQAIRNLVPIPGKAIVYVVRPTSIGFAIRMSVYCDSTSMGKTAAVSYLYTVLDPGTYNFLSKSENKSYLSVSVEAGKIYYLHQQVKMGALYARTKLVQLDNEKGRKLLEKCRLDESNKYNP